VANVFVRRPEERAANAALLAAAPDLASALLELMRANEELLSKSGSGLNMERARAALRKAGVLP
jgi:hypothetical protein